MTRSPRDILSFILCIFFAYLSCVAKSDLSFTNPEDALIQAYLSGLSSSNYDARIPPEGNNGYGSPVEVYATMYILDIQKVDDFSMEYAVQMYFRQSWNDSRLQFLDQDISSINLKNTDKIWTPDLFFVEEKAGRMHNLVVPNVFCLIQPNGEVRTSVRLSMTFSCPMDLRKYPHDTQKCAFNIESYGYTKEKIELQWDRRRFNPVSTAGVMTMLDFDVDDVIPSVKHTSASFGEYTNLQVTFTFKRKSGFFFTRLYVPFIILSLLTWLSFWIKLKLTALRLSLLLVVLYFMVTIGTDINSYIPPVSYTKGSDVWMAFCESLVFASFLELIVVTLIKQKEKKCKRNKCTRDAEAPVVAEANAKILEMNTESMTSSANIVACRLKGDKMSVRIDYLSKLIYPILFLMFNIVYWPVYYSG